MQKIFILFHGRFPGDKAAALFAAEEARSFAPHAEVTVVVPRRMGRGQDPHAFYGLPKEVSVVYLPTLDLFSVPLISRVAYEVSALVFSLCCFFYFLMRVKGTDVVISNEPLPLLIATLFSKETLFEVHDFPEHKRGLYTLLFSRVRLVLATNTWKQKALIETFGLAEEKCFVERNAVDVAQFAPQDKTQARDSLKLPQDAYIALYTGHLYGWKGVDTLAEAALLSPNIEVYVVGGTESDIAVFTKKYGHVKNIHVIGMRPHTEIPLWQAAADVLVLPNTAREEVSMYYTSPMKLFEYMASGRPIIASRIPSILEVLPESVGFYAEADAPDSFAKQLAYVCEHQVEAHTRAEDARKLVAQYTWSVRAERILSQFSR